VKAFLGKDEVNAMYTRILVPLDGSYLAEQVLPYVRVLACAFRSQIELLSTFSPPYVYREPNPSVYPEQIEEGYRSQSMDYLRSIDTSLADLMVPVSRVVHIGDPASLVVSEAEREPGTLIAMSTHGRSGISRWVLGSVTDKVIHTTATPVLVVRPRNGEAPESEVKLDAVIVALDGSSLAEQSLPHVVALGQALRLTVFLVRVASGHEEAEAREYLDATAKRLRQKGVNSVKEVVLQGHPAERIIDFAHDISSSVVVMTTHGRSGMGRWIMGSVTDRVVRHSGHPVLVVRTRAHE
jgi:nucleotide-binding universal stress UspA family protein